MNLQGRNLKVLRKANNNPHLDSHPPLMLLQGILHINLSINNSNSSNSNSNSNSIRSSGSNYLRKPSNRNILSNRRTNPNQRDLECLPAEVKLLLLIMEQRNPKELLALPALLLLVPRHRVQTTLQRLI
jgi:hypothetical protein